MPVIVDANFNSGSKSIFDSQAQSGDLVVSASAAAASTAFGLRVDIDDTSDVYGEIDFTEFTSHSYRYRFYIDPNTLTIPTGQRFVVFALFNNNSTRTRVFLRFSSSTYQLVLEQRNDDSSFSATSNIVISDAMHYAEVNVVQSTNASSNDGTAALYIDGVLQETITGLDLFSLSYPDRARMGGVESIDSGTSGSIYMDELIIRDDNVEIGQVTVTPVVITDVEGAHSQSSISVYYKTPPWNDALGRGNVTDFLSAYSHVISADRGFDTASITLSPTIDMVIDWAQRGLGREIEVRSNALKVIWEGFVDQINISFGRLNLSVGPLTSIKNSVYYSYSDFDLNTKIVDFGTSADSVAKYGTVQVVENGGKLTSTMATNGLNTLLQEQGFPDTSYTLGGESGITITLQCKGFYHLFSKYIYINGTNNTYTLREKLIEVVSSHPDSLFSTNYVLVEANTMSVFELEDGYRTADTIIKELIALGGASDNNRRLFGVQSGRQVYYRQIPSTALYALYIRSSTQDITTLGGVSIDPWNIRAGEWVTINDFPAIQGETDISRDPRSVFIESVTFNAPSTYSIQSGNVERLPQMLAKLGGHG